MLEAERPRDTQMVALGGHEPVGHLVAQEDQLVGPADDAVVRGGWLEPLDHRNRGIAGWVGQHHRELEIAQQGWRVAPLTGVPAEKLAVLTDQIGTLRVATHTPRGVGTGLDEVVHGGVHRADTAEDAVLVPDDVTRHDGDRLVSHPHPVGLGNLLDESVPEGLHSGVLGRVAGRQDSGQRQVDAAAAAGEKHPKLRAPTGIAGSGGLGGGDDESGRHHDERDQEGQCATPDSTERLQGVNHRNHLIQCAGG